MMKFRMLWLVVMGATALAGCQAQPRVITRTVVQKQTEYVPIDPSLFPAVQSPSDLTAIEKNSQMWQALVHDNGQLGVCKAALDGIRALQPALGTPAPEPDKAHALLAVKREGE